jgi:hypothetical protein
MNDSTNFPPLGGGLRDIADYRRPKPKPKTYEQRRAEYLQRAGRREGESNPARQAIDAMLAGRSPSSTRAAEANRDGKSLVNP